MTDGLHVDKISDVAETRTLMPERMREVQTFQFTDGTDIGLTANAPSAGTPFGAPQNIVLPEKGLILLAFTGTAGKTAAGGGDLNIGLNIASTDYWAKYDYHGAVNYPPNAIQVLTGYTDIQYTLFNSSMAYVPWMPLTIEELGIPHTTERSVQVIVGGANGTTLKGLSGALTPSRIYMLVFPC